MGLINSKEKMSMKKVILFSGLLVIFLLIGSTIAIASAKSSEQSAATKPSLAPEDAQFVYDQANKLSNQPDNVDNGHKKGHKNGPFDRSYLSLISNAQTSFPTSFDLRNTKVTSVKDQGSAGTCWAFAAYGALESYLMPQENWDFSENNMKNELSNAAPLGFDFSEGGNEYMSTAYLTRWSGPVNEIDDKYDPISVYNTIEDGFPVQKHVQDVLFIPDRTSSFDNNGIKSAVQKYGALQTTMYYSSTCDNTRTHSYYYKGSSAANHAVDIVGWNDDYKKNNFTKIPPGNGAFIVKNSWGTRYGDKGYFYVSYYDSVIGKENSIFTDESTTHYSNIYQYDPLGLVKSAGYGSNTAWCANIFTAKSDETLKAVSSYMLNSNCNYVIYIYTDPESTPTNQAGPVLTQSGVSPTAGYHTIPLNSGVSLKQGQKFSVVLKIITPGFNYPIPIEEPVSGYSSKATANPGQSFISYDGTTWQDITTFYANTNVCIKAFS